MVDLLVALAQAICVCGLAYGAWLAIRCSEEDFRKTHAQPEPLAKEPPRAPLTQEQPVSAARSGDQRHAGA